TLAEIWDVSDPDAKLTRHTVVQKLLVAISSSVASRLDVVSVNVTTGDPVLSKGMADAILAQLNRFNLQTLQSRASAERKFAEGRMNEVQGELRVAEDGLQRFLEDNRQQYLSPALEIEKARRGRKVDLLQQTFTTLATSFELARIDEVRDTPLITIIQRPAVPIRPDPRGVIGKAILALLMGLFLGSLLVLAREALHWMRSSGEADATEFNRLVSAASQDVLRLRSVLSNLPRRGSREEHISS
ncbi:MAG: lipopolysaccharide biosynthesis protein, partial [Gemmatimonadetes bacterium]|nr:lipopolysaccharide biosynthesis protein [Gemmatimonadota bacterium]